MIHRSKFSDTQFRECMCEEDSATLRVIYTLNHTYATYAPIMMHALGFPTDVLRGTDFTENLVLSGLRTDDGQSTCDVHRDPPAAFPASICGPS
eukprot:1886203-Prymnesium_polylepis.1